MMATLRSSNSTISGNSSVLERGGGGVFNYYNIRDTRIINQYNRRQFWYCRRWDSKLVGNKSFFSDDA